jgi:hypothetical protein
MPYVYEGDEPVRVNGVRYTPGSHTDDESVKGKSGFKKISDDEAAKQAAERPGNYANAKPDAWQSKFGDMMKWVGQATVAAPLNVVVGDDEAPYGPPTGTITTKQAVMRDASSSVERKAFGDHEWVGDDEENLGDGTSAAVSKAQARESGSLEKLTEEYIQAKEEGGAEADMSGSTGSNPDSGESGTSKSATSSS